MISIKRPTITECRERERDLMMLKQPQKHGDDDLLLCLEVFAQIGFVRWSYNEEIKHDTLQRRQCCSISKVHR